MKWTPIVGKRFTPAAFALYVATLEFDDDFTPEFVVVHNTQIPTLKMWSGPIEMKIQERWFRHTLGWSAGPHLYVDDIGIYVFTPLTEPGVHSPSWNRRSWGLEVVGDFDKEAFGDEQKDLVLSALETLHRSRGWTEPQIRFHKEDPGTVHTYCPGKAINKVELVSKLTDLLEMGG